MRLEIAGFGAIAGLRAQVELDEQSAYGVRAFLAGAAEGEGAPAGLAALLEAIRAGAGDAELDLFGLAGVTIHVRSSDGIPPADPSDPIAYRLGLYAERIARVAGRLAELEGATTPEGIEASELLAMFPDKVLSLTAEPNEAKLYPGLAPWEPPK